MEVKRRTAKSLISKLGSVSEQARIASLCELRLLTKTDPEIRSIIADEGAIPYIADTLYSSEPLAQENATATLLNLSISCRDALMSTPGVLDALSHALSYHTLHHPAAVQAAAATIYSLVVDDSFRPIVGSKRDILYALVDIIRNPNSPNRSVKDALKALFGISLCPMNRANMVELGAVEVLFGLVVKAGRVGLMEDATAVIAQIAGAEGSLAAFRRVSGVRVLVDLIDPSTGSSLRIKENAVSGLLNLVQCGGGVVGEKIREMGLGSIFDGLDEVAQTGSNKGRKRAETLMKILENGRIVKESGFRSRNESDHPGSDSYSGSHLNSGALLDPHSY